MADTKAQLIERIDRANELFRMLDEAGESVLLRPHDTAEVLRRLDYDL